jgi:hypothetical protein
MRMSETASKRGIKGKTSGRETPKLAWALVALVFFFPTLLLADGGTLRVANVPMGAYRINVFTDPTPIPPDSIDVSILATFERGRGVAVGLEIEVEATRLDGSGATLRHSATRDQADDPRYYAAKFSLGQVGAWRIRVRVRGEEGEGEVFFDVEVQEPGLFQNPFTILFLALLPLALVGFWLKASPGPSEEPTPPTAPGD